ncbi:hypothetical protein B0A49_02215, partial [Cryomyces minteri]
MALIGEADDDEIPQLSTGALDALKEFYGERDSRQRQFEDLKAQAEDDYDGSPLTMEAFTEDWNASQFWYSDATATALAEQLLEGASNDSCIAVVSAPSVFIQLKNIVNSGRYPARPQMHLLEYDERFAVFKKEFVLYDFEHPMRLPAELKGKFDRIICDPPFLSADCQTKAALTVRWLSKSWASPADARELQSARNLNPTGLRLIVCTGERMEPLITKLYGKAGTRTTSFNPEHSKGLSNEFRCYANFECREIPSMKLFESEKTLAFLDIGPLSFGHALVIPKYHGAKLTDIPDDQLSEVLHVTKKIATAVGAENYNILQNNGRAAHQEVDH